MMPPGLSQRSRATMTGGEHPLVDAEPSEPLGDDHVDPFRRLDIQ